MKKQILVVDDDFNNIQAIWKTLGNDRYNLSYALNGEQGLKLAVQKEYDLVVLDYRMPGMTGEEVCRKLKANPSTAIVPVIFLTGSAEGDTLARCFKAGACDYLTKPFSPGELLARINTHLELKEKTEALAVLNADLDRQVHQKTEQLAKANHMLGQLDQAKSDFMALVSHELRTPLNAMKSVAQLLKMNLRDPQSQELLNLQNDAYQKLENMVLNILLVARLKAEGSLRSDLINLDDLKRLLEEYNRSLPLPMDLMMDMSGTLRGDRELIVDSLLRLLDNASRYCPPPVKVRIELKTTAEGYRIKVRDNGPGYPKWLISSARQAFLVADVDHHQDGFGLSLFIIHLIMDLHGGSLTLENNRGACASMTFI